MPMNTNANELQVKGVVARKIEYFVCKCHFASIGMSQVKKTGYNNVGKEHL